MSPNVCINKEIVAKANNWINNKIVWSEKIGSEAFAFFVRWQSRFRGKGECPTLKDPRKTVSEKKIFNSNLKEASKT
jgi:hypothetical protein